MNVKASRAKIKVQIKIKQNITSKAAHFKTDFGRNIYLKLLI